MTNEEYHLGELGVALDPTDPRRIAPPPQPASKRVLDIGCGAGQTLIAAYPDRISYGVDVDADALGLGNRITGQVRFAQSQAEQLPFRESEFDLVVSRVAIPYTDIQTTLSEIHRVLKPGGEVWLTLHTFSMVVRNLDLSVPKSYLSFAYVLANSALFCIAGRQFRVMGRCESFQTPNAIRRVLQRTGFEETKISLGRHFVVQARVPGPAVVPACPALGEGIPEPSVNQDSEAA